MLELRELTLVEMVLTVLESVLTVVCRPVTSLVSVPTDVVRLPIVVERPDTAVLIELTLDETVPRLEVMELTSDWSVLTELVRDAIDALSFVMFVPRPARPVTSVVIVASALEVATPPLTVKEPMFEAAKPEVALVIVAPTR